MEITKQIDTIENWLDKNVSKNITLNFEPDRHNHETGVISTEIDTKAIAELLWNGVIEQMVNDAREEDDRRDGSE